MRTYTRAELRDRARVLADDENGQIATDAQYNDWIDESYGFVYDILVQSGVYPEVSTYSITIASLGSADRGGLISVPPGQEALAPDHYATIKVLYKQGTDRWRPLSPLNPHDWHKYDRTTGGPSTKYLLYGEANAIDAEIRLFPQPNVGDVYKIVYVPEPTLLSSDSSDVPSYSGWFDRFIVVDVALKARLKEESGIRDLQNERNEILAQIEKSKMARSIEALQLPENPSREDDIFADPAWRRW